jgi:predicted hotdog family 3-hydroxylacyl-ACP dehydratase
MAAGKLIETEELLTLIPHKGKMVLLSRVLSWDTDQGILKSAYDITGEELFYDPSLEGMPGWISFECMAQSVSALIGIQIRLEGKEPPMGFILSISDMEVTIPVLKVGATVISEVHLDYRMENLLAFDCKVFLEGSPVAAARLTVMEADDRFPRSVT